MQSKLKSINIRPGKNKTTADYFSRSTKAIEKYPSFEMCGNVHIWDLLEK